MSDYSIAVYFGTAAIAPRLPLVLGVLIFVPLLIAVLVFAILVRLLGGPNVCDRRV